jgi:hypothetical protein
MRDHELELIAALVEGRLADETEARALIAGSAEAREEYEAQKLAYQSLRAMGTARLTETERAALHRDLWTDLRGGEAPGRTKAPWYLRWGPVAAGLFVIVGIVAVLGESGPDAGSADQDIIASGGEESEATTTTADAGEDMSRLFADDGAETATTEAQAEGDAAPTSVDEAAIYSADAERVRAGDFRGDRLRAFTAADSTDASLQMCVDEATDNAGLERYEPVAFVTPAEGDPDPREDATTTTTDEGSTAVPETAEVAVAVPDGTEPATAPLAFVDLQTCTLVHLDQPTD